MAGETAGGIKLGQEAGGSSEEFASTNQERRVGYGEEAQAAEEKAIHASRGGLSLYCLPCEPGFVLPVLLALIKMAQGRVLWPQVPGAAGAGMERKGVDRRDMSKMGTVWLQATQQQLSRALWETEDTQA